MLTLAAGKAMAAAAEAFALARGWTVAIAVGDPSGGLILLHWLDEHPACQPGDRGGESAKRRATAPADQGAGRCDRRWTDRLPQFRRRRARGRAPVRVNGQVVGAIGVSGMTSSQESEVADAGLQALQV